MRFENIIKNLKKDGYAVVVGEFNFEPCIMCKCTALVDLVDFNVVETTAKYKDVVQQIENNRSHIQTIENGKRTLANYNKLGF